MSTAGVDPIEVAEAGLRARHPLPKDARVGRVTLAVSNLERSLAFYTGVIGLHLLSQTAQTASLGTAQSRDVLLGLQQEDGVRPIGRRTRLGLYHSAFLLPDRNSLSRFVRHLAALQVTFGTGDHVYSEAMYLTDPDGLSVEVYADRLHSLWVYENGEIVSGTSPVDISGLMAVTSDPWQGVPEGTTVGHVHFYVGDLATASTFYHDTLGLDIMTWRYPGALFTGAGGYHHHVGLNIWAAGSPLASQHDARLLTWELTLRSEDEVRRIQERMALAGYPGSVDDSGRTVITDPWGIRMALVSR